VHCPELVDDLFGRNPLAVSNLLATLGYCGIEASPIFGIELVIILLDELKADFGTIREVNGILDDDSSVLNATAQQ
jgi:hypothetical protein